MRTFTAVVERDADTGLFVGHIPGWPGAHSQGATVDELLANRVQPGQKAVVRAIGTDKVLAEGDVIYAAPLLKKKSLFAETAGEQEDRRVREVKILLHDPKNLLLNARVECEISL